MAAIDWFWAILLLISLAFLLQALWMKKEKKRLPPGPRGLPLVGHLHLIGQNPHQDFYQLAKKYGPIMHLRFGYVPHIIVSSPQAAEQFLKTHDHVFAGRPPHEASKYIAYGQKNIVFGQYGPYWRTARKLLTLELLTNNRMNSFQPIRREELILCINTIKQAASEGVAVDLSATTASLSAAFSCLMVFGNKFTERDFSERGFKSIMQDLMAAAACPNLADYFPYIGVLDLQGLNRRFKALAKVFDKFFERIISEHVENPDQGQAKDFIYTMLAIMESEETQFQFDRGHVKALMLDVLAASMDTSASAIEWTLAELMKHPQVLRRVQEELQKIVGMDRMVEESDLEKLEYLDMVIKEGFRLHPPAPLLIPHAALEDATIDGYQIPKNSRIMINVWAIGQDPNSWKDPEVFDPERFLGSNIDVRGRDFQLLPFGSGRRGCPGIQLGLLMVKLTVAQMVHCFNWKLPDGMSPKELDMVEEFGIVVSRANHLMAVPTYRLHK